MTWATDWATQRPSLTLVWGSVLLLCKPHCGVWALDGKILLPSFRYHWLFANLQKCFWKPVTASQCPSAFQANKENPWSSCNKKLIGKCKLWMVIASVFVGLIVVIIVSLCLSGGKRIETGLRWCISRTSLMFVYDLHPYGRCAHCYFMIYNMNLKLVLIHMKNLGIWDCCMGGSYPWSFVLFHFFVCLISSERSLETSVLL